MEVPDISEKAKEVLKPLIDKFIVETFEKANEYYGPFSGREELIVKQVTYTVCTTMIQMHEVLGGALREEPSIRELWKDIQEYFESKTNG